MDESKKRITKEKKKKDKFHNFFCIKCNFSTQKSSNFTRHVLTKKHIKLHSCENDSPIPNNNINIDNSSIIQLLKENNEIKQMLIDQNYTIVQQNSKILELCKSNQLTPNQLTQTTNNITNNNTFNLNVFLNETCKDAMNIVDFIESIDLQLKDLLYVGQVGYVRGISDIIIHNLKKLDITKRPLHCSDYKREIMYIKDKDIWEKDTEQKEKLRKVVKEISMMNSRNLPVYKQKYPDCWKLDSKKANEYDKIMIESLGGLDRNIQPNQNKIMKNIAKQVFINKDSISQLH
jgi:hypothetical protein